MYYDEEGPGAFSFVAGILLGTVLGASLALLAAPQSGKRTRRQLRRAVDGVRTSASDRFSLFGDDVRGAVRSGRRRLRD